MGAGGGELNRRGDARDVGWPLECAHVHAGAFIPLRGTDPRTFYPRPSWDHLVAALDAELALIGRDHRSAPVYAVLNLSRLAYSYRRREVVVSKVDAAAWALASLPDRWHRVIRAALATYHGHGDPDDQTALERDTPAFLRFVEQGR